HPSLNHHHPLHSTPSPHVHPPSLHDALPISHHPCTISTLSLAGCLWKDASGTSSSISERTTSNCGCSEWPDAPTWTSSASTRPRSEEHTSELQSRFDLVCRLLLEKNT